MAKTAEPARYTHFCRQCWHRGESDTPPMKLCLRTTPAGKPCHGGVVTQENPAWTRKRAAAKAARPHVPTADRKETDQRAGSKLTKEASVVVWGGPVGNKKQHGTLDMARRLYQSGGEAGNFIWRKENLVTLAFDVWKRVEFDSDVIELVDHTANRCYRCRTYVLRRNPGREYDAGIGRRIGWPIDWFEIVDDKGEVVVPGNPPAPQPAQVTF